MEIKEIEISSIKSALFERIDGSVQELAKNIAKVGLQEPIRVRELDDGFEVIVGWRRLQAAKIAGLKKIPVIIDKCDEATAIAKSLSSDIFIKQLTDYEVALRLRHYMQLTGIDAVKLADRLGKSPAWISKRLQMLELKAGNEVWDAIKQGVVNAEHISLIKKIKSPQKLREIVEVIKNGITIRDLRHRVREIVDEERHKEELQMLDQLLQREREKLEDVERKKQEKIHEIDDRIKSIESEISMINKELEELRKGLKEKISPDLVISIDKIESEYKSARDSLWREEEFLSKLKREYEDTMFVMVIFNDGSRRIFDANDVVEKEHAELSKDLEDEIRELENRLDNLRKEKEDVDNVISAIRSAKRRREILEKQIRDQECKVMVARKYLEEIEKNNSEILECARELQKSKIPDLIQKRLKLISEKEELEMRKIFLNEIVCDVQRSVKRLEEQKLILRV